MSGYMNNREANMYWPPQEDNFAGSYYEAEYNQFQDQSLDFKPFELNNDQVSRNEYSAMYDPTTYPAMKQADDPDELPLLEELEIYPDRIMQKILAVMNPFRGHGLTDDAEYLTKDPDLAGPISFYLILGVALFLSGKPHFGCIYLISVGSCLFMYSLLTLMTTENGVFNLMIVASILGYSLIPIVGLSVFGIFFLLQGIFGILLASLAVIWSSFSASRLFLAINSDKEQQFLIAFPCALVSGVYVLLILF